MVYICGSAQLTIMPSHSVVEGEARERPKIIEATEARGLGTRPHPAKDRDWGVSRHTKTSGGEPGL
ncbi:MAG: hypothetical protein MK104_02700 [Erythrobacter sp.]|nr:hypothetical protein [Erythrobacter sp.]